MKTQDLSKGTVIPQLLRMTVPMIGGMLSLTAFNLIDTWYISMLGTEPLAAMGFSFPVIMLLNSFAMGLGMGISTVLAQVIGKNDSSLVKRITSHGLLLNVIVVSLISIVGFFISPWLFARLGAEGEAHKLVLEYMRIWFLFAWTVFLPMISNYAIRATGDTKVPALIMVGTTVLNGILDPLLIFGYCGFPRMGIAGAALATAVSRALITFISLYLLHKRYHMLEFKTSKLSVIIDSWKRILHISLPTIITNTGKPAAIAYVISLVSMYGDEAVAGVGAGDRIQMLLYMFPMAMGSVLIPFCGQNYGAGKIERIHEAWHKTNLIGFTYGAVCFLAVLIFGRSMSSLFSEDPTVIKYAYLFLSIVFIGSGYQFAAVHSIFVLNAIKRPLTAGLFDFLRSFLFTILFAKVGGYFWGVYGIFASIAVSNILGAGLSIAYLKKVFKTHRRQQVHSQG